MISLKYEGFFLQKGRASPDLGHPLDPTAEIGRRCGHVSWPSFGVRIVGKRVLKLTEEVGFSGRGLGLGAASRDVARPVASLCCLLHLLQLGACARWAGEVERGEDRDEQGGADNYLGEKPGSTRNALRNGSA